MKLKPCPFCGGIVKKVTGPLAGTQMFVCRKCGADVCFYGAEHEPKATEAWNMRGDGTGGKTKEIRINLNENVKVKLTDRGRDIYYHQYDDLPFEPQYPKEDQDGYATFQLWDFMRIYGGEMWMHKPNVICPLEIVYEVEEDGDNDD